MKENADQWLLCDKWSLKAAKIFTMWNTTTYCNIDVIYLFKMHASEVGTVYNLSLE